MSRGSPIVPIRIPVDLLAQVDAYVARSAHTRPGEPYTRSSWIIKAIEDRIAHARRSSRRGRKSLPETVQNVQIPAFQSEVSQ
jgi:hypothetical protein